MKKVNVLLSSYNGEKYIREQIDSILAQTWEDVTLYVRDDGSSDGTVEILHEYEAAGKIVLETGSNVGFIRSFFRLIEHCAPADYYAFADQDDVWMPDKLAMAVERLHSAEEACIKAVPLLYFSNYDYYDGDLHFISHAADKNTQKKPSFVNAIVDCMPLGFNSVFNDTARQIILEHIPHHSCGHDWWVYLICAGMGQVIYDDRATVKYRRTGSNVSPGGMDFVKHQIWRIKKFVLGGYFKNVRMMLGEYYFLYQDRLSRKNQRLLSLFVRKKYNLIAALKKMCYPHRFRQNIVDELMVRALFLIGKL